MNESKFGIIIFSFLHEYNDIVYNCEAEVYIDPPIPQGESDWDCQDYREVTDLYIEGNPILEMEDIGLTQDIIFRYHDMWLNNEVMQGFSPGWEDY